RLLDCLIARGEKWVRVVVTAAVGNRGRLQYVPVGVHRERHAVCHSWISELGLPRSIDVVERALVVKVDRLAGVGEEHGMTVSVDRLQKADGVVALGYAVGEPGGGGAVGCVN